MADDTDKGFTIKDRRTFNADGNPVEYSRSGNETAGSSDTNTAQEKSTAPPHDATSQEQAGALKINFSSFVLSLSSSVLYHFGEIPDPVSNKKQRNLLMAKQTIDILGILKEKTAGNLTQQEEALLSNLLYDLRMRYVQESEKDKNQK
jgi:PBP1b-binding outer membrane lipoprotein LpoB